MIKLLFLWFAAFCFGTLAAAGVFTIFATVGLVPRFAGKTHTASHIMIYENMIALGTVAGAVFSMFTDYVQFGQYISRMWIRNGILSVFGLFSGMFIGCLALAIAEMLDSIPIFSRRISFRHGLGVAITCMAIGKLMGSLFYFMSDLRNM